MLLPPNILFICSEKEACSIEDGSDPTASVPSKKVMPKRGRSLSRKRHSKSNQKIVKAPPPNSSIDSDVSDSLPVATAKSKAIKRSVTTESASRKLSKSDLERELKLALEQNAILQSQLAGVNKKLLASESRREATAASLRDYQSKARESRKALKHAESAVDRQAKQLSIATEDTDIIVEEKLEQQKRKHLVSCGVLVYILIPI